MFDFIQKLMYSILAFQEKILRIRLKGNFKSVYSNTTSKKVFGRAASLELNSQTEKNKVKLENDVTTIIKKYGNDPQKLLEFIERSGTKVYKMKFAHKILGLINHEEGFVAAKRGIKALFLNVIISLFTDKKIKITLKTQPMFILRDLQIDGCFMIQQFHKWYAMKLNLPGFDAESQNNFQKYLNSNNEDTKSLSVEEILGLKEAIARDVEAINFIIDFAKSTTGAQNAMKKMTTGGASV